MLPDDAIPAELLAAFRQGLVIPAHPMALDDAGRLSERHQRALSRYYVAAGVGGVAVGVHSTQFEIRDPKHGLFEPILTLAAETVAAAAARQGRSVMMVAGICGQTAQALREASFARTVGYHAGLLSLSALKQATIPELLDHCRQVAAVLPVIGFYLHAPAGGRPLPYPFWRQFAELPGVIGIKLAPFNRYQTFAVVRAVAESGREIALYTGNDDNLVVDLLTTYRIHTAHGPREIRIGGGLLGHWAVWTRRAVELLSECHRFATAPGGIPQEMLTRAAEVTDTNAAFFDPANNFAGCIPGIHEVLRRQGLIPSTRCLDPKEVLSPGQAAEIDRVQAAYPHLNDDQFVREHLHEWLQ